MRFDRNRSLIVAALLAAALTVIVFYPGVMSPDSIEQLRQVEQGRYAATVPPLMTFVWRIAHLFVGGPLPMLVLQAVGWWCGLALVVNATLPRRGLAVAAAIAVGFWPPLFAMIGTVWKDVHLTVAFVLAVGLLLRARQRTRGRDAIVAALLLAYGVALRPNVVFSVLPLAAWACHRIWRLMAPRPIAWRRASVALCLLGILGGGRMANLLLRPEPWTALQNLLVFDLVGISARSGRNFVPAEIRNGLNAPQQIAAIYSAFSCVPAYSGDVRDGSWHQIRLLTTTDAEVLGAIEAAWWRAVRAEPRAYLAHRTAAFMANLGWDDFAPYYPFERGLPYGGVAQASTALRDRVYDGLDWLTVRAAWLFRPWIYAWLTVAEIAACILLWLFGGRLPARTAAIASSALLYTLPYAAVAPAADLRYHHWPIAASLVGLLLLQAEIRAERANRGAPWRFALLAALLIAAAPYAMAPFLPSSAYWGEAGPRPPAAVAANEAGVDLLSRAQFRASLSPFETASRADPWWYAPEVNLGIARTALGDEESALAHFDEAVRRDRGAAAALAFRGEHLLSRQRYADALNDFTRGIHAGNRGYVMFKGAAAAAAGLGAIDLAVAYSARCIELNPAAFSRDVAWVAAPFFTDHALYPSAVEYFRRLEPRTGDAAWVHAQLARLAQRWGDSGLARLESSRGER